MLFDDTYVKDPDSVLDYTKSWSTFVPSGDAIVASVWTVPTGLTLDSNTFTDTTATAWISGGTLGDDYVVANEITTQQGRTDERSILIRVRER